MLTIRILNKSKNPNPAYATKQSAGMDLRADIENAIELKPLERKIISTGIYIELAAGYEAQIRPRSGLAINHGITMLNTPGTIDADYRGEIKVIAINLSNETYSIQPGDKIAQMIISKHEVVEWESTDILTETERADGGFGHSGK